MAKAPQAPGHSCGPIQPNPNPTHRTLSQTNGTNLPRQRHSTVASFRRHRRRTGNRTICNDISSTQAHSRHPRRREPVNDFFPTRNGCPGLSPSSVAQPPKLPSAAVAPDETAWDPALSQSPAHQQLIPHSPYLTHPGRPPESSNRGNSELVIFSFNHARPQSVQPVRERQEREEGMG